MLISPSVPCRIPLRAYCRPVTVPCLFHLKEEELLRGEDGGEWLCRSQPSLDSALGYWKGVETVITVSDVQKKGVQRRDEVLMSPLVLIPNVFSLNRVNRVTKVIPPISTCLTPVSTLFALQHAQSLLWLRLLPSVLKSQSNSSGLDPGSPTTGVRSASV